MGRDIEGRRVVIMAAAAILAHSVAAYAALKLNEIFINPPGADDGTEFVEIAGNSGESLTNVWFVTIEGDKSGTQLGVVDQAINLTGLTCGSNGLLLLRDAPTTLAPAPETGTNVHVHNFSPDLENGSCTFLLVTNFTGSVGMDLDASPEDGVLDSTPWSSVLSTVGIKESGDPALEFSYAGSLGGYDVPMHTWTPDVLFYVSGLGWVAADVLGSSPGPFTLDPAEITDTSYVTYVVGPGVTNPSILAPTPTPSASSRVAGFEWYE